MPCHKPIQDYEKSLISLVEESFCETPSLQPSQLLFQADKIFMLAANAVVEECKKKKEGMIIKIDFETITKIGTS